MLTPSRSGSWLSNSPQASWSHSSSSGPSSGTPSPAGSETEVWQANNRGAAEELAMALERLSQSDPGPARSPLQSEPAGSSSCGHSSGRALSWRWTLFSPEDVANDPRVSKIRELAASLVQDSNQEALDRTPVQHRREFLHHQVWLGVCRQSFQKRLEALNSGWMDEVNSYLQMHGEEVGDPLRRARLQQAWDRVKADLVNAQPRLLFSHENSARVAEYAEYSARLQRLWTATNTAASPKAAAAIGRDLFFQTILELHEVCRRGWASQIEQAEDVARAQGLLGLATVLDAKAPAILHGLQAAASWRARVVAQYGAPLLSPLIRWETHPLDVHVQEATKALFDEALCLGCDRETLDPATQAVLEELQLGTAARGLPDFLEQSFWTPLLSEQEGGYGELNGLLASIQQIFETLPWDEQEDLFPELIKQLEPYVAGAPCFFQPEELDAFSEIREALREIMKDVLPAFRVECLRAALHTLSQQIGVALEISLETPRTRAEAALKRFARDRALPLEHCHLLNERLAALVHTPAARATSRLKADLAMREARWIDEPEWQSLFEQFGMAESRETTQAWHADLERLMEKNLKSWPSIRTKWKCRQILTSMRCFDDQQGKTVLTLFGAKVWLVLLGLLQWDESREEAGEPCGTIQALSAGVMSSVLAPQLEGLLTEGTGVYLV